MPDSKDGLKAQACAKVDAERGRLIGLSSQIHGAPELKFEERRAAQWLSAYLELHGFAVEREAYGLPTAFVARLGKGEPRVAILCEYDALPGVGHACGHNIIAAAGAGAAAGAAAVLQQTGGSLLILGTPAEEGGGGKILMGRAGAFDGVDAAMMVHPAGVDLHGMHVLAVSQVEVEYRGRAAHASAFPHRGVNALDALVTAYSAIAQLRQHIRPTERVHGIFTDGGQAPNIVPERAAGLFMIRATSEARLEQLKARVFACFRAGAEATGATVDIRTLGEDYSDMWTNRPLALAYEANAARVGRTLLPSHQVSEAVAGSTDMGNVSKWVPSIHPMIASAPSHVPLHSPEFARWAASEQGDRAVIDGAKMLAMTAIDVLCDAELRVELRDAFAQQAEQASKVA